jgi:hypothetical protein
MNLSSGMLVDRPDQGLGLVDRPDQPRMLASNRERVGTGGSDAGTGGSDAGMGGSDAGILEQPKICLRTKHRALMLCRQVRHLHALFAGRPVLAMCSCHVRSACVVYKIQLS